MGGTGSARKAEGFEWGATGRECVVTLVCWSLTRRGGADNEKAVTPLDASRDRHSRTQSDDKFLLVRRWVKLLRFTNPVSRLAV